MLYSLSVNFVEVFTFLNVFKYLTVRTGLAVFTSMFVVFIVGNPFIKFFSTKQILDPIREDGPSEHIIKIGTPTMGGVLILLALFSGILLWGDLSNFFIWFLIFIVGSYGLLGAYDDYRKIKYKNLLKFLFKFKIITQILIAVVGIMFLTYFLLNTQNLSIYIFRFLKI